MRISRFLPAVWLSVVMAAPVCGAELSPASVWLTDFAKAEAEARALHRPLVVHFHTRYCPPCRKMEKEVLHTPQVLSLLDQGFVAVKVDLENARNEKLQTRFRVESMPTDLILAPDGTVLGRSEGYQGASSGDKQKYIASITRVDEKFAAEGKRLARSRPPETGKDETRGAIASNDRKPAEKLVPEPLEPRILEDEAQSPAEAPVAAPVARSVVGLDGYCPVTLRSTRSWKAGSPQFSLEHEGQMFLFTAAAKRDEFQANPARYAPRLMGCDPVRLVESDLAIRGSTKFGAYYDGSLFLFESADNRAKFRKDPARYSRIRHALKPEEIRDASKLASTAAK